MIIHKIRRYHAVFPHRLLIALWTKVTRRRESFMKTGKRLLSILLCVTMVLNTLPGAVFASLLENTSDKNTQILQELTEFWGDEKTAQEAMELLHRYSLIDEDGNILTDWSGSISILEEEGSRESNLSELLTMIEDENADRNMRIDVDGTVITLGDFEKMMEIESEIRRIQETYFAENGTAELTQEQTDSLLSLYQQISANGITLYNTRGGDSLVFPSGVNQTVQMSISGSDTASITSTYTLTVRLNKPQSVPVTYSYRALSGSISASGSGTRTIGAGSTEDSFTVSVGDSQGRMQGSGVFVVQVYDVKNALFENGRDTASKTVRVSKSDVFKYADKETFVVGKSPESYYYSTEFEVVYAEPRNKSFSDLESSRYEVEVHADNIKYTYSYPSDSNPDGYLNAGNFYLLTGINTSNWHDIIASSPMVRTINQKTKLFEETLNLEKRTVETTLENGENLSVKDISVFAFYCTFATDDGEVRILPRITGSGYVTVRETTTSTTALVSAPAGVFGSGEIVPITVRFGFPMKISSSMKLTVNGQQMSAVEEGSTSESATFLYTVPAADSRELKISSSSLSGTGANERDISVTGVGENTTINGVSIEQVALIDAVDSNPDAVAGSLTYSPAAGDQPEKTTAKVSVTLELPTESALRNLIVPAYMEGGNFYSKALAASIDGGQTLVPLKFDNADSPAKLTAEVEIDAATIMNQQNFVMEFYTTDPDTHESTGLLFGRYAAFSVNKPVPLLSEYLSVTVPDGWPKGSIYVDNPPEDSALTLIRNVNAPSNATWTQTRWVSSDETVATIDEYGRVCPLSAGKTTFYLEAVNGGLDVYGEQRSQDVVVLHIAEGAAPYLRIPQNTMRIRSGDALMLRWASNLVQKNAFYGNNAPTTFDIKVYRGGDTPVIQKSVVYDPNASNTDSKLWVNGSPNLSFALEGLTEVSQGGQPSYTIVVSAEAHEDVLERKPDGYSAEAQIFVTSKPVSVKLTRPETMFVVNAGTLNVPYTLTNFDAGNSASFELVVTDNSTGNEVYRADRPANKSGGSFTLDLSQARIADGFRTIYDVSVKAKNTAEKDWSRDSFTLYIYDKDSLDILVQPVNGRVTISQDGNTVTMSNEDWIKTLDQNEIIALSRDINLQTAISINYGDHAWGEASDRMRWVSKNSGIAAVNYPQGAYYENIESIPYSSYAPATEFLLSGKSDGTTKVEVMHDLAKNALSSSVDVNVKTLKDKLYLFQFYPSGAATITYKNGKGESKTQDTDASGRAAVYEESGIASDVYVEAEVAGEKYLGTVYKHNLLSQERDAVSLELYPLNSLNLRKAATVPVYLKKPDGSNYTGEVKVRTGVYRNGVYCADAKYTSGSGSVSTDGDSDSTVTFTDGKAVFRYDMTQFNTDGGSNPVSAADNVRFIIELRAEGYYPVFFSTSGNINADEAIRLSEHVVNLEAAAESQKNKPFIAHQVLYFDGKESGAATDVRNKSGRVGPSADFKDLLLSTTVLWWGETNDGKVRSINYVDGLGTQLKEQTSEDSVYPFLSMPVSKANVKLNKKQFENLGMKSNSARRLSVEYVETSTESSGETVKKVAKKETMRWQIINLDAESVVGSRNLKDQLKHLMNLDNSSEGTTNIVNDFLGMGIKLATKVNIDTPLLRLKLAPTSDPAVFKGLLYMGLNNFENDNVSHMGGDSSRGSDIDYFPGFADMKGFKNDFTKHAKTLLNQVGTAANILKKNIKQGSGTSKTGDGSISYALQGIMETEVYFDFESNNWKMVLVSGGFTAGGGYGYEWTWNTQVGPVPVFLQLGLGAAGAVEFNAAVDHTRNANDYLTELRIYAYLEAFGGLGFDYSVIALKIGLYGSVQLKATLRWLNAAGQQRALFGAELDLTGEIGIKIQAKLLFISYEKILWSKPIFQYSGKFHSWDYINTYWQKVKKGNSGAGFITPGGGAPGLRANRLGKMSGSEVYSADQSAIIQDRDYLEQYERSYDSSGPSLENTGGTMLRRLRRSLRSGPIVKTLENSYPLASPSLTDDGKYLFYLHDSEDSTDATVVRAAFMERNDVGGYEDKNIISGAGFGDSGLRASGSGEAAVAVWSRLTKKPGITEPGQKVTPDIQADMMNNSDIVVAVRSSGGGWTVKNLIEDNGVADLSPVVATNGERIMVAWRQVASSNANTLTDFGAQDYIYYAVSEGGGANWTKPQPIYNGNSGSVKGIEAAMLESGEAAVVFTINKDESGQSEDKQEVAYAVIDKKDGAFEVLRYVQMTDDENLDENPQIAAVKLTESDDKEVFIIGWYSLGASDDSGDIRLAAVDAAGNRITGFVDSMSRLVENSDVGISSNFEFVQNAGSLDELSVLWSNTVFDSTAETGHGKPVRDSLNAIRFRTEDVQGVPRISMTSAQQILNMDNFTTIDNFSAYVNDQGILYAALQGTYYDYENTQNITVNYGNGVSGTVTVAQEKTSIYTAAGRYTDTLRVDMVLPDYANIRKGTSLPVQFSVTNLGTEPITKLEVALGDSQTTAFEETPGSAFVAVAPGETRILNVFYNVPASGAIPNPKYKVTGTFSNSNTHSKEDTLVLNVPDLGIADSSYLVDAVNGDRILQFTLYNTSDAELKGSNRNVRFALYRDVECTELIDAQYLRLQGGATQERDGSLTVSGEALSAVDEGSYTVNYKFDLEEYIKQTDLNLKDENGEVRDGGVSIYAKAWVELPTQGGSTEAAEMVEYIDHNNLTAVNLESLLKLADGNSTTITSELSNPADGSGAIVTVTLQNNSMAARTSGNVIVSLMDDRGKVVEQVQSFNPDDEGNNYGLLTLDVEGRAEKKFRFSQPGASVQVTYSDAKLTAPANTNIASVTVEGAELSYDSNAKMFYGTALKREKSLITVVTEDPRAKVKINGVDYTLPVTHGLVLGDNTVDIEVIAQDGRTKQTYKLRISNVESYNIVGEGGNDGGSSDSGYYSGGSASTENDKVSAFVDISKDSYYYEALVWAVKNGIVKGTSETTFSPEGLGTRAQVVTLLWRAAGSPLPKTENTSFTDIGSNDYYYSAALWAVENGITKGTGGNNFGPYNNCTRAQMVTFLWRAAGSPEPKDSKNPFADVGNHEYYYKAVLWAAENGITNGTSATSFSPNQVCTRSQIVTFLFRSIK